MKRGLILVRPASRPFHPKFELIAATSGASVVALLLGLNYTPAQIVAILEEDLPNLTSDEGNNSSSARRWARRFFYLPFHSRYSAAPRLRFMRRCFGSSKTMADLRRYVAITAFRVDPFYVLPEDRMSGMAPPAPLGTVRKRNTLLSGPRIACWGPVLFSNMPSGPEPNAPLDTTTATLVDIAMRATATPVYYPVYQVGERLYGCVCVWV